MRQIYETKPLPFETVRFTGTMTTIIRIGIEETEEGWACEEVYYDHKEPLTMEKDYAGIIAAIVRSKYSADDMEAVINNYLLTKTTLHKAEWNEMQSWRALAKATAETILTNEEE
jgi:hypothetical protein